MGLREAQALESAIGRARWGAAALAFLLGPLYPHFSLAAVFGLGIGVVGYNILVLRASKASRTLEAHRRVERFAFAADLAALASAMFLFSADPYWTTWVIGGLVITGAAFRFGSEGTLSATIALGSAYLAIVVFRDVALGYHLQLQRVAFDLSVFILTALMVDRILGETRVVRSQREGLIGQLERRVAEDEALLRVGRIVGSLRGASDVIPAVLAASRSVFRFDRATVFTIDAERGEYRAIHRLTEAALAPEPPTFRIGEGLIAVALAQDRPLLVRDVLADPRYVPSQIREARRSVIIVPLRAAAVGGAAGKQPNGGLIQVALVLLQADDEIPSDSPGQFKYRRLRVDDGQRSLAVLSFR